MAISRDQLRRPALPKETVDVPALGGEVVVRGLLLSERLEWAGNAGFAQVAKALATCVTLDDGKPALTAEEWEAFGGAHLEAAIDLFQIVKRLSGLGGEAEKKADTDQS